ncbi:MAG: SDR family NAD(P)-dependent oxidoreductase [Candidatus Sericytochromatia bacterium]
MDLSGKRVVVTGASRGIGEALARAFAAAGATVALVARTEDAIGSLAAELGGTAHPADLSDASQVATLVRRVEDDAGPIDVLVNNAGVSGTGAAFPDTSEDNQRFVMQVNYLAPAELCRQVIPRMRSRGGGHIVNVSSMAGCVVIPGTVAYSASKAALSHFTAGLRADLRGLPIGTTLVELGPIPTDMLAEVEDYEPTERGFRRFYRLHLVVDVPRETVADEVVDAVRRGRRHVRIPKRAALFPMLSEAPRRTVELLLSGVPARADPGTGPAALDERRPRAAQ